MDGHKLQAGPTVRDVPPAEGASVDVVIVSADMAEMTLDCVARLDDASIARIVVVDNASGTSAADVRARFADGVTVVTLDRQHGFAAANNRGVAAGDSPFVLLLNSDILTPPEAIATLLAALEDDPGAVAAGGRLVDPDTLETQPGYRPRPFPTLANFAVILLGIEEAWPGNPITRRYHGAAVADDEASDVEQPAAAALLVRRADLEAIGGFDERFWFWFEDSDLLRRLHDRGRIRYVPAAAFRHLGGGTFRRWNKPQRIRSIHHGILHYGDAHFPRWQRAALGLIALLVSVPRVVVFARARPEEARAWRAVAAGGWALTVGRRVPAIAPGE